MRHYEKGDQILSLDEVANKQFIFVGDRLYHSGWFQSWQFRHMRLYIQTGMVYEAVPALQFSKKDLIDLI